MNVSIASNYSECIQYIDQECLEPLDYIRCSNGSSVECRLLSEGCSAGFSRLLAPAATFQDLFSTRCECVAYEHYVVCETTVDWVWECQVDYLSCANDMYPLANQVVLGPMSSAECDSLITFDICDNRLGTSRCELTLEGCLSSELVSFHSYFALILIYPRNIFIIDDARCG